MHNFQFNPQFDKNSTASEVLANVDLTGRLFVLTGATSGIGISTAQSLVAAGADIVVGARNGRKLKNLMALLDKKSLSGTIRGFTLDLMSPESVDSFADSVVALSKPVDVLINNAGMISGKLVRNADGIESQLMTNFIGHAILTSRLSDALKHANGARVVSLSSIGHHYSPVLFDDLNFEKHPYNAWDSYGQAKTACVLLAVRVSEHLIEKGVDAFAVHPGGIRTGMAKDLSAEDFSLLEQRGTMPAPEDLKTLQQGAATTVWASTDPQLKGLSPLYLEDCRIAKVVDQPTYRSGVVSYALASENASRLWRATEKLIGRELDL